MNYYRRYIGDYGRDTTSLSLAEHGAYALLLDAYYADEHALPADLGLLNRICRATDKAEQAAVKRVADKFFPVNGDGLRHNARADRELGKAKNAIEQMTEAGRRGAGKRWGTDGGLDTGGDRGGDRVPHKKGGKKRRVGHAGDDAGANAGGDTTTTHQPPTTSLQTPGTNLQPPEQPSGAHSAAGRTNPTWLAYAAAYEARYHVAPVRNRKINGLLAAFVERVPAAEAPDIAAFYVGSEKGLYRSARHCVDLLLRDAEGLRTEWVTGRRVTDTEARQADQTATRGAAVHQLLAEKKVVGG
jgi:uncharacterized protein YdaU (DUF1376 family)